MRYFKVQVVSCDGNPNIWYAGKMGQEFVVSVSARCPDKFNISNILFLRKEHCRIISEIDKDGNNIEPKNEIICTYNTRDENIRLLISNGNTTREVSKLLKVSFSTIGIAVHGNN